MDLLLFLKKINIILYCTQRGGILGAQMPCQGRNTDLPAAMSGFECPLYPSPGEWSWSWSPIYRVLEPQLQRGDGTFSLLEGLTVYVDRRFEGLKPNCSEFYPAYCYDRGSWIRFGILYLKQGPESELPGWADHFSCKWDLSIGSQVHHKERQFCLN